MKKPRSDPWDMLFLLALGFGMMIFWRAKWVRLWRPTLVVSFHYVVPGAVWRFFVQGFSVILSAQYSALPLSGFRFF